jgi:PIN domain nuclease of toxin-antitoxin system
MIVAQALVEGVPVLTEDVALAQYGVEVIPS